MGEFDPRNPNPGFSSNRDMLQWQELRDLLTGPEQRQLDRILKRLDDPVQRAEELYHTLPDALSLGGSENHRIARALQPLIDTAIKRSARRNPKVIADAIFPSLGPAIRKAISATLMSMVQSLNHVLNQGFSLQGIKWRIEALRTHKSFAEVVMLHTLVYRVEQIFVIHRKTGIMLQHANSEQVDNKDPDLVSGMLTAIQDFVSDSFDSDTGQIIDTLRMDGDHSVWIENGAEALLAVVIRGTPPVKLRRRFRKLLDDAHTRFGPILEDFDGETSAFAMLKPDLQEAMSFQVRNPKQSISPMLWVLTAAGVFAAALLIWKTYDTHRHWQRLVDQLRRQEGIVVTHTEKRGRIYHIEGLKDPMAPDTEEMVTASGLHPNRLRVRWEPFIALDEASILRRARKTLMPPKTARLELAEGILVASGAASHQWIRKLRRQSPTLAGVAGFNDTKLRDIEMEQLVAATAELERHSILFARGEHVLPDTQSEALARALDHIRKIRQLSQAMGVALRFSIIGQTDPTGPRAFNLELSRRRAMAVKSFLVRNEIDPAHLDDIGAGAAMALEQQPGEPEDRGTYRSVRFKTHLEAE